MKRNRGEIRAGSSFAFDRPVISYWSQWLGHANPHILIVGQDFGDVDYFEKNRGMDEVANKTNDNLFKLLNYICLSPGRPPKQDIDTRVFLTNSILCLKKSRMNGPVSPRWVQNCALNHLRPLVQALAPQIVVAMGVHGWHAVRVALKLEIENGQEKITVAAGKRWTTGDGIQVFAVGHCGPLGIRNRPWSKQREDWSRIGEALTAITRP